ncbi:PH domain-containing protein [uncultured Jatrophihabitans sp.]|uniref:PH domain-containing protein n=1 Tax=uncultured Jatrophihabitans sp. TaxID=1610747 RepID=UPI0035C9B33E
MSVIALREPAHLVSERARLYWTVRALPAWLAIAVLETTVLLATDARPAVVVPLVVVTAALALTRLVVMPQWRFRVHRWEITDTAVYTQTGWLTQQRRIAPLARVQTVDTRRGPFEQLFGLADVTVTTASAKGPISIHALDSAVAEHVVQWLTERAQASTGDGT